MKFNKKGSGLLLVIFVMTAILLACLANWRSTNYIFDVVLQRGICEKKRNLTYGLLNYGIAYSIEQFDLLSSSTYNTKIKTAHLAHWPTTTSIYNACLSVEVVDKRSIKIKAELIKGSNVVDCMSCVLQKRVIGESTRCVVSKFIHV